MIEVEMQVMNEIEIVIYTVINCLLDQISKSQIAKNFFYTQLCRVRKRKLFVHLIKPRNKEQKMGKSFKYMYIYRINFMYTQRMLLPSDAQIKQFEWANVSAFKLSQDLKSIK